VAERDRTGSNGDLARKLARVADVLAEFEHLPPMESVSVDQNGSVYLCPKWHRHGGKVVLAQWAKAFGVPVVIDMSSSGYLRAVFEFGGFDAKIEMFITQRGAYELGAALQIPVSPGGQVEVPAEALLAVLDGEQVTA
jgi:hypothetical protein